MLKRIYLLIILVICLILAISILSGCKGAVQASLDSKFTLSLGKNANIASESMDIKFVGVSEDSRCPKDVQCVWAGEVTCEVLVTKDGTMESIFLTQTGLTDTSGEYLYQDYKIVFNVSPYPEAGKQIKSDDYRLELIISKSSE